MTHSMQDGSTYSLSVSRSEFLDAAILTTRAVFDLVSAYGTVGLSLGVPFVSCEFYSSDYLTFSEKNNYSFAGALQPLSKFILCLVMIRGRHRGLPMAIDRAVMLPSEFRRSLDQEDRSQRTCRHSSAYVPEGDDAGDGSHEESLQPPQERGDIIAS